VSDSLLLLAAEAAYTCVRMVRERGEGSQNEWECSNIY